MAANNWLGPRTALFNRWVMVVEVVAVITVTIVEVDSRSGFGFPIPRPLYSIILGLAQLSSCLLLGGIGIRLAIWVRDRRGDNL
jgi:hypothetical protein